MAPALCSHPQRLLGCVGPCPASASPAPISATQLLSPCPRAQRRSRTSPESERSLREEARMDSVGLGEGEDKFLRIHSFYK